MTVKATTLVLLTGALMVLVGCSSAPSEADLNAAVEAKLSALDIEGTIDYSGSYDAEYFRELNSRIIVLQDGETGTIDRWKITASFDRTRPADHYATRDIYFKIDIAWMGQKDRQSLELMSSSTLNGFTLLVAPSGDSDHGSWSRVPPTRTPPPTIIPFAGLVEFENLPDMAGTFFLVFSPHPYKPALVWPVDLPQLPVQ